MALAPYRIHLTHESTMIHESTMNSSFILDPIRGCPLGPSRIWGSDGPVTYRINEFMNFHKFDTQSGVWSILAVHHCIPKLRYSPLDQWRSHWENLRQPASFPNFQCATKWRYSGLSNPKKPVWKLQTPVEFSQFKCKICDFALNFKILIFKITARRPMSKNTCKITAQFCANVRDARN